MILASQRMLRWGLLVTAALGSYWGVIKYLESRIDPHAIGLAWMRNEYQIDDETFAKICRLHEQYFAECESMTSAINAVERPLLHPTWSEKRSTAIQQAAFQHEQELCDHYEAKTIRHLQKVAALLKPEQAERFLRDFAENVHQQRMEHQRALQERVKHD